VSLHSLYSREEQHLKDTSKLLPPAAACRLPLPRSLHSQRMCR
jgi:hypothetical protein